MTLKNWVGQEINVGDLVSYGARCGNTTTIKVGEVLEANPGEHPKVLWRYEPTYHWERDKKGPWREITRYGSSKPSTGRPDIDKLFLLHPDTRFV